MAQNKTHIGLLVCVCACVLFFFKLQSVNSVLETSWYKLVWEKRDSFVKEVAERQPRDCVFV